MMCHSFKYVKEYGVFYSEGAFFSGVVVIDMRELSCLFIRFPPCFLLCAYSCRERMLLASIFASLPPLPYYSSL